MQDAPSKTFELFIVVITVIFLQILLALWHEP